MYLNLILSIILREFFNKIYIYFLDLTGPKKFEIDIFPSGFLSFDAADFFFGWGRGGASAIDWLSEEFIVFGGNEPGYFLRSSSFRIWENSFDR